VDGSSNVFVTGSRASFEVDFGGGLQRGSAQSDIFILKLSADGAHLWSKTIGAGSGDAGAAISIDPRGDVLVAGTFGPDVRGGVDFGGGRLPSAGWGDIFLAKYAGQDGVHLWSRRFGGIGHDGATAVAIDPYGDVFVSGVFSNTVDFGGGAFVSAGATDIVIAKYSAIDGTHLWSKRVGGSGSDSAYSMVVDPNGDTVMVGAFSGTVDFGGGPLTSVGASDIFVVKYSGLNGSHLWSKRFGGSSADAGTGITVDGQGNVSMIGYFSGSSDFGGGLLTSAGSDVFIAKYSPAGLHLGSTNFGGFGTQIGNAIAVDRVRGNVFATGFFLGNIDFGSSSLAAIGDADVFLRKIVP
jgi:hypothetical protein